MEQNFTEGVTKGNPPARIKNGLGLFEWDYVSEIQNLTYEN